MAGDTTAVEVRRPDDAQMRAWRALYAASGRTPFESPDCLLAWAARYDPGRRRTRVLFAYDGDTLIAAIPLHLQQLPLPGHCRLVMPGADRGAAVIEIPAALIRPGSERRVWRAAVGYVAAPRRPWSWAQLSLHDDLTFEPDWLPSGAGNVAVPLMTRTSVVVRHDGSQAASRRNLKESLRRSRNRLTRAYGNDWAVVTHRENSTLDGAYARLLQNHRLRAQMDGRRAHHDVMSSDSDVAVLGDLVRRLGAGRSATIHELRVRDRCVAGILVVSAPRSSYLLLTGMDETAWEYSPLTLLTAAAVRDSVARGDDELRLPTGVDTAKLRWSRTLARYEEFAVVGGSRRDRLAFHCYEHVRMLSTRRRLRRAEQERSNGHGA